MDDEKVEDKERKNMEKIFRNSKKALEIIEGYKQKQMLPKEDEENER